ncbi:protein of unknown function [Pararobbsia alpina]
MRRDPVHRCGPCSPNSSGSLCRFSARIPRDADFDHPVVQPCERTPCPIDRRAVSRGFDGLDQQGPEGIPHAAGTRPVSVEVTDTAFGCEPEARGKVRRENLSAQGRAFDHVPRAKPRCRTLRRTFERRQAQPADLRLANAAPRQRTKIVAQCARLAACVERGDQRRRHAGTRRFFPRRDKSIEAPQHGCVIVERHAGPHQIERRLQPPVMGVRLRPEHLHQGLVWRLPALTPRATGPRSCGDGFGFLSFLFFLFFLVYQGVGRDCHSVSGTRCTHRIAERGKSPDAT